MSFSTHTDTLQKYLEASFYGAARGLLGLPLEHPFDTIKTKCQAAGGTSSPWMVTNELWKKGFSNFYSGALPNSIRVAAKQFYRWPMMLAFPSFFKTNLPIAIQEKYPSSIKAMTGITIASFEVGIITPLERLKVYLMTNPIKNRGLVQFYKEHKGHFYQEFSRGIGATFAKQMTSWVSFLVADEKLKYWEKKRTNTTQLSYSSLLIVSMGVGMINTAVNLPFDAVKTHLQKKEPIANTGLFQTIKKLHNQYGTKGLYAGWQIRLIQYMIQSVFTVSLLDKLENSWKR